MGLFFCDIVAFLVRCYTCLSGYYKKQQSLFSQYLKLDDIQTCIQVSNSLEVLYSKLWERDLEVLAIEFRQFQHNALNLLVQLDTNLITSLANLNSNILQEFVGMAKFRIKLIKSLLEYSYYFNFYSINFDKRNDLVSERLNQFPENFITFRQSFLSIRKGCYYRDLLDMAYAKLIDNRKTDSFSFFFTALDAVLLLNDMATSGDESISNKHFR